jgi:hypothetical protein
MEWAEDDELEFKRQQQVLVEERIVRQNELIGKNRGGH